jgi:glutamate/tyrosine decarboxylase-like PLP-dependent enzyme
VDPLEAIADVAKAHGLWHHVDGAYGAFFALTADGRAILSGMDRSDSLVMDPHKTLFLPYGSGVVLVRDRAHLLRAFTMEAAYMQDALAQRVELSPADLSPELTRPFRGLRLWLPLLLHGLAPFRAALEEKLHLARYFRTRVAELGFEVGPEPDLSVVIYRYVPEAMRKGGVLPDPEALNRINRRILERIHQDGRVFISSTMLGGLFTLRFACVVHRTHLETVDRFLDLLAAAAEAEERAARVASPATG